MYRFSNLLSSERGMDIDPSVAQIYILYSASTPNLPPVRQESPERLCERLKPLMPRKLRELETKLSGAPPIASSQDPAVALEHLWTPDSELRDFAWHCVGDSHPFRTN
ncbi:uncharacterized protein BXIN_2926 [Babesia sp. Xinjiang]|uniref:uncharacterized protein n=1 Tax=Babesia sp. Xinjiang TaxID=462227 RepID=UPI000A25EB01|nr:uncharacterized protein BXIN_2926 [Babesia sp. Xinjiang]ORM39536.1 hypothetical protein BXIN_2926 [Babesia sp. Xinjiang]